MTLRTFSRFVFFAAFVGIAGLAHAQAPAPATPPPPLGWTGSASAGLALTQGNNDTSTVNAAYELKRDTGGVFLLKSAGLLVWGKSQGELTNDQLVLSGRGERKLNERTSLFGQVQYLRDSFKAVDYLISPTIGVSRLLLKNANSELAVDGGVGIVWEQDTDVELKTDGAVTAGQQFSHKLTATTEFKQKVAALWKMDDFGDALYAFNAGIAVAVTSGTQMKVEFLDTYKTKPSSASIEKNDIAILLSFVYKF